MTRLARILGVDAGTHKAGLAVLRADSSLVMSLQVALTGDTLGARLTCLRRRMAAVVAEYRPTWVAVETAIRYRPADHASGSASVGQGYGIVCQLADELGLSVLEVAPASAKVALTGSGKASKELMQMAARRRWRLAVVGEDEADALGVALAGLARLQQPAVNVPAERSVKR